MFTSATRTPWVLLLGALLFGAHAMGQPRLDLTDVPEATGDLRVELDAYDADEAPLSGADRRRYALLQANYVMRTESDEEDVAAAIELIEATLEEHENDQELMAALGSLYGYRAGFYADDPTRATFWFSKSVRQMDRAVAIDDTHIGARLYRGMAALATPAFLNRTSVAVADFRQILETDEIENFDDEFKALVLSSLRDAYLQQDDTASAASVEEALEALQAASSAGGER